MLSMRNANESMPSMPNNRSMNALRLLLGGLSRRVGFLLLLLSAACALSVEAAQSSGGSATSQPGATTTPQTAPGPSARLALVVGNGGYRVGPLANPTHDARAVGEALRRIGFDVIVRYDLDQRGMQAALREFGARLQPGGLGLFFFAGHGLQLQGRNYLLPVDADIQREDEVAYRAVDAQAVLDTMQAAGSAASLLILDACRNNPLQRTTRSAAAGLAPMQAPAGSLVAFATAPGAVAIDGGAQGNGLYTRHLLRELVRPGVKVEESFKRVRAGVRQESGGRQVPWEVTSLEGDVYFVPPVAAPAAAAGPPADPVDDALWDAARTSGSRAYLTAYLERFPQGRHAQQARALLNAAAAGATSSAARSGPQVGDRYRFQEIDLWTRAVVRHVAFEVTRVFDDGDVELDHGRGRADAWLRSKRRALPEGGGELRFEPVEYGWEPQLQAGETRERTWTQTRVHDGAAAAAASPPVVVRSRISKLGNEPVTTPAGTFEAERLQREGSWTQAAASGVWRCTTWFVAALRLAVAEECELTDAQGQLSERRRTELTSYALRRAAAAAQR
jgi:uncharacterized caspase-like protein